MQPDHVRKPRVVYIHGDNVINWASAWVPSVAKALRENGFETFFELFPDSIEARARYWLPFLEEHVQAGEDDVLLGWSCGAVAAMRYAQSHRVRGLVLVAPYFTDLGLEEVRRSGFVVPPWNWDGVRANAPRIVMFHSDADPYISQAEFAELAIQLSADVRLVRGAGHFSDIEHFADLTDYVVSTYR